jgi:hypothetical protein
LSSAVWVRNSLSRRKTWHERAEHEHYQQRTPQVLHVVSKY